MVEKPTNALNISDAIITKAWSYVAKMRGISVVNETSFIDAQRLLEEGDEHFKSIEKAVNDEIAAGKQHLSMLRESAEKLIEPFNSSRNEIVKKINAYTQFMREIAARESSEISNVVERSKSEIEEEYTNQMLAERQRLEKLKQDDEKRAVVGYVLEDKMALIQAIAAGEMPLKFMEVNDANLMDIGRRYKYKIKIPGITWVKRLPSKNGQRKGEILYEIQ